MEFKEENFPLYQLLLKLGQPGVENARADFAAAAGGGDEEKYSFVHALQTLPSNPQMAAGFPGMTPEIAQKTLKACLEVYEDVGSRGHVFGAYMAANYYAFGRDGIAKDAGKAKQWIDQAVAAGLDGGGDLAQQIKTAIAPKPARKSWFNFKP